MDQFLFLRRFLKQQGTNDREVQKKLVPRHYQKLTSSAVLEAEHFELLPPVLSPSLQELHSLLLWHLNQSCRSRCRWELFVLVAQRFGELHLVRRQLQRWLCQFQD